MTVLQNGQGSNGGRGVMPDSRIGQETTMMQDEPLTYSLTFHAFAIDFLVDEVSSHEENSARAHRPFNERGVFVVADTWLRIGDARHFMISEVETHNLIILLKTLAGRFRDLRPVPDLERLIPRGGLCAWKRGYWNRIRRDLATPADETGYNLLISQCVITSNDACLAFYQYDGRPTIEAASDPEPAASAVMAWCEFDPADAARQTDELVRVLMNRFRQ